MNIGTGTLILDARASIGMSDQDVPQESYIWEQSYMRRLDDFELSVRTTNACANWGMTTVYHVANVSRETLAKRKGFDIKSINELAEVLSFYGVDIGELV